MHMNERSISIDDRGFTHGDGVFDTALAIDGEVLARDRHLDRLTAAARAIGIAVDRPRIETVVDGALTLERCILRTVVTRGSAPRGLWPTQPGEPTILVNIVPWSRSMICQPARLVTASGRRNEFSPTANLKTLGYLDQILAAREAALAGADDALMLNTQGRVCCTTIANVVAVFGDRLVTPPITEGCLPGVMRALVMEAAPKLGLGVEERPMAPDELLGARAVFLTNSVRFLRPATDLDGTGLATDMALMDAFLGHLGMMRAA